MTFNSAPIFDQIKSSLAAMSADEKKDTLKKVIKERGEGKRKREERKEGGEVADSVKYCMSTTADLPSSLVSPLFPPSPSLLL